MTWKQVLSWYDESEWSSLIENDSDSGGELKGNAPRLPSCIPILRTKNWGINQ
jgi:hypothetical protein